jgi:hypothetical protein
MKRHWGTDELVEHWTLLPRETELLTNKTGATKPQWKSRMRSEDLRALTPLIYSHVTPYGRFRLDMNERLVIETAVAA